LLGVGCVDAVERAILTARVGAIGPRAGRVGVIGLAGGHGVVRLVVAGLWVNAVTIVAIAAVVVAAATRTVAHALLWSIIVGV